MTSLVFYILFSTNYSQFNKKRKRKENYSIFSHKYKQSLFPERDECMETTTTHKGCNQKN